MEMKWRWMMGFLAVMAVTGALYVPNAVAGDRRADLIETTKGMATQVDSNVPPNSFADARQTDVNENFRAMVMPVNTVNTVEDKGYKGRVDVIDSVTRGGERYPYSNPINR